MTPPIYLTWTLIFDRRYRSQHAVRHRELGEHGDVRLAARVVPGAPDKDVARRFVAGQERPDGLLGLAELVVRPGRGLRGVRSLDHAPPALDVRRRLPVERRDARGQPQAQRVVGRDVDVRKERGDQAVAVGQQAHPAAHGGVGEVRLHAEHRARIGRAEVSRRHRLRLGHRGRPEHGAVAREPYQVVRPAFERVVEHRHGHVAGRVHGDVGDDVVGGAPNVHVAEAALS